jgi:spore photoproduct lyase
MRVYKKEFDCLEKSRVIVEKRFPMLGVNKKQEITRLIFEISKKENLSPETVLGNNNEWGFDKLKLFLLKRRFPAAYFNNDEIKKAYLPKVKLDPVYVSNPRKTEFYPKRIFIEKTAQSSRLARRFRKSFPKADFSEIISLKDYLSTNRRFTTADYNKRHETVFITHENYDFFKKCPCTKKAAGCGYHIFNLSFGCVFECAYCYLQEYTNTPGIIFPANIDKFFDTFDSYKKPRMRIGTGEFSDSLMLDHITEYSMPIIDFFKNHPEVTFEFKTKSVNISNLLKTKHSGNIVAAWSLNPQKIIDENEFLAPSLKERLEAAKQCAEAGYKLAFHFDPVIYFEGWREKYKEVITLLFSYVTPKDIAWISIGTLRFNPGVKQVIETRFPGNKILDGELLPGFDGKLRYPSSIRYGIYRFILETLFRHSEKLPVYLCMEDADIYRHLDLRRINFLLAASI